MTELEKLIKHSAAGVSIFVDDHKTTYESVEDYFRRPYYDDGDIDSDVYLKMVELDTIVCVTFYPDTPVGHYDIYHYDINKAISISWEILKKEKNL